MTALLRTVLPLLALAAATPAAARPAATARLVACKTGDCLLVRGHRASPGAAVRINGRAIEVAGGTAWQARLPVATVRGWSAPYARSLVVATGDATAAGEETVRLPVGMFARPIELASLIVRAR